MKALVSLYAHNANAGIFLKLSLSRASIATQTASSHALIWDDVAHSGSR